MVQWSHPARLISVGGAKGTVSGHGHQMKISLLGQFGSGNSGNDGSLEAMLIYLRRFRPDAELLCICSNPALITARHNIRSVNIGGPPLSSRWAEAVEKIMPKLPRRIALLFISVAQLTGFDLMIIPGTGILDDFQENAFGWPFVVFCWCLVARVCGVRIAFISIGAGPINGRLSRWFLYSAARMASYRSYRDQYSLDFMRGIGLDVSRDRCYPDIAFALPTPYPEKVPPLVDRVSVAVGVMNYRGWRVDDPRSDIIYADYIGKLSTFICWLLQKGFRVTLLTGDATDQRALGDVMQSLAKTVGEEDLCQIETNNAGSLHDIMAQIGKVDMAVVSRYHNLVCSLKMGRPSISLGYARKNDDLMSSFNQNQYCFHIETFKVDELKAVFGKLLEERLTIEHEIKKVNERWQNQLLEQQLLLRERLLSKQST
jgi:polysaccharide pyruvyl transferase WcaK-like protein